MKFKTLILFVATSIFISCAQATAKEKEAVTEKPPHSNQTIKVALLLDTSNSMDGLINQAKAQLWEVVNELSYAKCEGETPNLEIALYQYGNDGLSDDNGFIKLMLPFTKDLDEISEQLFALTTNGGEEYCGTVIQTSVQELNWGKNQDDLKMIFIAGNEPFTQGTVNFKDAITNAKERDITINTIFCGNYNQGISGSWKEGADLGNGDYMTINHNKAIVHVATPYDDEIINLNKKLNKTYVRYGSKGVAKVEMQAKQDENASKLNKEVAVKRAVSKSSKLYKNSSWDLVDAVEEEDMEISEVNKNQLPKELKDKSEAEIKTYVAEKAKERKALQKEIQELNKKRASYVAKKQVNKENELESALKEAIKTQAKKKNYSW